MIPAYQQIIIGGLGLWVMWNASNVINDLIEIMSKITRKKEVKSHAD